MHVESLKPQELSANDRERWREAVATSSSFGSPFFHPEYVSILSEYRPQIEVAVARRDGEAIGWLPFERHQQTSGRPLGIKMADFQGLVLRPGETLSLRDVMPSLGLTTLHFDHLIASQVPDAEPVELADSPYLDLREGYEAYAARQRSVGDGLVSQVLRKQRKLRRDAQVDFRWQDDDPLALDSLWCWKGEQRQQTGTLDILQFDWVREALSRIGRTERPGFRGRISTLRINGEIAAVHLGMQTDSTFHYWFPAYAVKWSAYSPGLILLMQVAEECARLGIQRIDLGKGDDRYKASFASGSTPVATQTVDGSRFRRYVRTSLSATKSWVKNSALAHWARLPMRWWRNRQTQISMGTR